MSTPNRAASAAHFLKSILLSKGRFTESLEIAAARDYAPEVSSRIKAAVVALTTADLGAVPYGFDVERQIREREVLGQLGARAIQPGISTLRSTRNIDAAWVAEHGLIPVVGLGLARVPGIAAAKVSAIVVATNESLQGLAETDGVVADDLVRAVVPASDRALLDPQNAGAVDDFGRQLTPRSLLYGIDPTPSQNAGGAYLPGVSAEDAQQDISALIDSLVTAGSSLRRAAWVMHPATAAAIGLAGVTNEALGPRGGSLLRLPVVTSPDAVAEPTGRLLALFDADEIEFVDQGLELDTSRSATVAMDTEPGELSPRISLFQNDLAAYRAIRRVCWRWRRPGMGAWMPVSY